MQNSLCQLKGIWGFEILETCVTIVGFLGLNLLILLLLEFFQVIALHFLEIVVPAEYNLIASETHAHRIRCKHDFLDSLRPMSFHTFYQILGELKIG